MAKKTQELAKSDSSEDWRQAMLALAKKAQAGDEAALAEIRQKMPGFLGPQMGDLAAMTRTLLVGRLCGKNLLRRESIGNFLTDMRRDLAGPDAPSLERLLGDRILTTWLQLQEADIALTDSAGRPIAQAEYFQRRQERAHKMFLASIMALAKVRRLLRPSVQINAFGPQVNVINPPQAESE